MKTILTPRLARLLANQAARRGESNRDQRASDIRTGTITVKKGS